LHEPVYGKIKDDTPRGFQLLPERNADLPALSQPEAAGVFNVSKKECIRYVI
jgi:hypothetical protein